MLNELITAATSINTLRDMLKTALDAKTYIAVNATITAMNEKIQTAQELISMLQARNSALADETMAYHQKTRELTQEIAQLVAWNEQRIHYRLNEVATGAFAYVFQPPSDENNPAHAPQSPYWLCCQCYDTGKKSILQFTQWQTHHYREFSCPRCQSRLSVYTPSETTYQTSGIKRRSFQDY